MIEEEVYTFISKWAQEVNQELGATKCYVFGSLLHKKGEQFLAKSSDIDLVIEIPEQISTEVEIVEWLERLKLYKQNLEQSLFVFLKRKNPRKAIVSILPVTKEELYFGIHKSKAANFFSENKFKCLLSDVVYEGIDGANEKKLDNELIKQVLEFCQGNRHAFLANTIHGDSKLLEWTDHENEDLDVIPKALMRHSAMVSDEAVSQPGGDEKYDLQVGLEHIYSKVYSRRHENDRFKELFDWLSVRRLARGDKGKVASLSQLSHLFLSEVLFGMATNLKETSITRDRSDNQAALGEQEVLEVEAEAAEIIISGEGNIPLSDEELFSFVGQTEVNLKWRFKPYFIVRIPELIDLSQKLSDFEANNASDKSERAELFHRYNMLKKIENELHKGIELLIWFQNYLIDSKDKRKEFLSLSIRQYCTLCFDLSLIRASRHGGAFECYNPANYSEHGTFGFSIPERDREIFFEENKIDGLMHLAAENRFVSELRPEVYALHFIPLLIKHGVDKIMPPQQNLWVVGGVGSFPSA